MKPLEGITVIEFAEFVTAPSAARFLSEWGARVIKVERPDGDRQRKQGQTFGIHRIGHEPEGVHQCGHQDGGRHGHYAQAALHSRRIAD